MKAETVRFDKPGLVRDLLIRAGVSERTADYAINSDSTIAALRVAADLLGDRAPDEFWFKQVYQLTGEHMVLTDEGWLPAAMNTKEHTGFEPVEVLDEVNRPTT